MSKNTHGCCADKACTDKTCMELPAGKTCGDCKHFRHCAAFYAHQATDTYCDFFPRRFYERAAKESEEMRAIREAGEEVARKEMRAPRVHVRARSLNQVEQGE